MYRPLRPGTSIIRRVAARLKAPLPRGRTCPADSDDNILLHTLREADMSSARIGALACIVFIVSLTGATTTLGAQPSIGTWVRQGADPATAITMTIEKCCGGGRKLTYHLSGGKHVMTVESPFDGTEVPVLFDGKPTGQTMAIKLVDSRHTVTTTKLNGKPMGVSKATLSADGKTMTVVNDMSAAGAPQEQTVQTETWVKK